MDTAITVAMIGGICAVFTPVVTAIVQVVLNHKGKTAQKLDAMDKRMDKIESTIEENEVKRCRTQILRFADEIYEGQMHSKEHFDDTLRAISRYNNYCKDHEGFKNDQTVEAQQIIKEIYHECQRKHSFLGDEKRQ